MLRKLILLALTAGVAKKLYDKRQQRETAPTRSVRLPFPTSENHPPRHT